MFVQWTTAISDIFAYHGPWSMHCIVRLYLHHFHVSQRMSEFYVWSSSPTMADIKKSNGIPLEMASKFPGHIVHRSQQHRPFTASSHINNNDVHCHRWRVLIFCCCAQLQTPNNRHHPQLQDWTEQQKQKKIRKIWQVSDTTRQRAINTTHKWNVRDIFQMHFNSYLQQRLLSSNVLTFFWSFCLFYFVCASAFICRCEPLCSWSE